VGEVVVEVDTMVEVMVEVEAVVLALINIHKLMLVLQILVAVAAAVDNIKMVAQVAVDF